MTPPANQLLARLPRKEFARLLARCEQAELRIGEVLCQPGSPLRHAYFPTTGFVSLLASIEGSPALEVGMVGQEGMLGVHLALGVAATPVRAVVQGPGWAWRIGASALRAELRGSAALRRGLDRYACVVMSQLVRSSACLHFHPIGPRLARWLLMSHDRAHADSFPFTHDFLAHMLGVRRAGITGAAGMLRHKGLIAYSRGRLTVLDRGGLEAAACSCYAANERSYAELLPTRGSWREGVPAV